MLPEALKKERWHIKTQEGWVPPAEGWNFVSWERWPEVWLSVSSRVRCLFQRGSPLRLRRGLDEGRQAELKAFDP